MDQILRYAMNIHESAEVAEIKQRLLDEPGAQAHLEVMRKSLELLNEDNASDPPPFNLAKKTILRVQGIKTQAIKYTPGKHINHQAGNYQNSIRRFDLLLAASLLIITCGVLAPWLHQAKTKAEKLACANNMREFHHSFQHYSAMQPDGKLPFVEPSGPRSFAGVYVPTLRQHGLLGDYHSVACPTNARKIPTETNLEQLESMYKNKSNPGYQRLVKEAGGDYAYNLGYNIKGSLVGLNNKSPGETPVLADKVNPNNTKLTFNHGGSGIMCFSSEDMSAGYRHASKTAWVMIFSLMRITKFSQGSIFKTMSWPQAIPCHLGPRIHRTKSSSLFTKFFA